MKLTSAGCGGLRNPSRWRLATVAAGLTGVVLALAGCSASPPASLGGISANYPTSPAGSSSKPSPAGSPARCPLSGTAAPNGVVPNHPAVAVKVENSPEGRPQYGLNAADIVYEEPVEGGISRFVAVYQCHSATRVEPVRSSRIVDAQIIPQLGDLVFAFDGGIDPSLKAVKATGARLVNAGSDAGPFSLDTARVAPHDLETSTSALLTAAGDPKGAPRPVFTYSAKAAAGAPDTTIHLDIGISSDVWWRWDPAIRLYRRYYGATASHLSLATLGAGGGAMKAANVVVESVAEAPSPYVEDESGIHENYVQTIGTGSAEVARDGVVIKGTWVHLTAANPTQLLNSAGGEIPLAPGATWIELLPTASPVSPQP